MESQLVATREIQAILDDFASAQELPVEAIQEARQRRDEITPFLVQAIRQANAQALAGEIEYGAEFYALYLLWEFEYPELFPILAEIATLPNGSAYELYSDYLNEDFPSMLAHCCGDQFDLVEGLINDSRLDEFLRWNCATAMLHLVRDGRLSRDDAISRLRRSLTAAIDRQDSVAIGLVMTLMDLAAAEAIAEVDRAFAAGLISKTVVDRETAHKKLLGGEAQIEDSMRRLHPTDLPDVIAHLQPWFTKLCENSSDEFESEFNEDELLLDDELPRLSASWRPLPFAVDDDESFRSESEYDPMTFRHTERHVGRNESCPCGSGKKYKKCCGAKR